MVFNQYASTTEVHYWNMLSVTLTLESMTLEMSSVPRGPSNE